MKGVEWKATRTESGQKKAVSPPARKLKDKTAKKRKERERGAF